jgi:hypothetical protein
MAEATWGEEVTDEREPGLLPQPLFHTPTDALRFWVATPDHRSIGASVPRLVLHYRFQGQEDGSDALAVYAANREVLDGAVLRRLAAGSREPVMLREADLPALPARGR